MTVIDNVRPKEAANDATTALVRISSALLARRRRRKLAHEAVRDLLRGIYSFPREGNRLVRCDGNALAAQLAK